jgi:glycerophosphoryl diester phosphodiesterase
MYQSAVVASFSPFVLYNVRKLNPKIVTLLIVKRGILQIYSKEHIRLSTLPQWVKSLFVATVPIWDAIMFWSCTNWVLHFLGVGVISFEHEFISEDLSRVSKFQKRGYQVNVWAVNDERDRKMLLDLGVAVTTDWF